MERQRVLQDVTFRSAKLSDAETVAEIYLSSRKTFLGFAPLAHTDDDVQSWIRDELIPAGGVIVAVPNLPSVQPIGMMALSREDEINWIDQLYLRPSIVGRGLGARFVERAKRKLASPIRLYTFQANDGARRFYESHGFRVLEFGDGSGNEENCPDVLYEWSQQE